MNTPRTICRYLFYSSLLKLGLLYLHHIFFQNADTRNTFKKAFFFKTPSGTGELHRAATSTPDYKPLDACRMLSNVCFYGHSQNSGNLGSSVFVSFSLGGAVEVAAALVVPPLLQRFGRRWPMVAFLVSSGLCGVAYAVFGTGELSGRGGEVWC